MATIFRLQKADEGRMRIREFDAALGKIQNRKSLRSFDFPHFNEQVRPFGILNVDCDGNYSTYSPELLGMNLSPYGSFSFGNILTVDFVEAVESPKFRSVFTDILAGINSARTHALTTATAVEEHPQISITRMGASRRLKPCSATTASSSHWILS